MSDGRVVIDTTLDDDGLKRGIKKLQAKLRGLGGSFGKVAKAASMIALPSALIPTLVAATGAAGGLASSLVAVGGALGAFGVAAIGNGKKLADHMSNIQKINEKIKSEKQSLDPNQKKINELLNQRANILAEMSKPEQQAMEQVNKLKDVWKDFLKVTEKPVFSVFADGLKVAETLLKKMEPIVKPVSEVLSELLQQFNSFANTKQFQSFINFFATRGADALKNWGEIAGNVFVGFMNLMEGFAPLSKSMEGGLLGLTQKFADWSKTIQNSDAFQAFLDYVKTNGKLVLGVLGNLFKILGAVAKVMAPLGEATLNVLDDLSGLIVALLNGDPIGGFLDGLKQSIPKLAQVGLQIIQSLLSGFVQALPQIIPAITQMMLALNKIIIENLPTILNAGLKILLALLKGFVQAYPQMIQMMLQFFMMLTNFIVQNLPMIIDSGMKILLSLINGLVNAMPKILPAVIKIIMALVNAIINNLPQIIDAGIKVLNALINGIVKVLPQLTDAAIKLIFAITTALLNHLPEIIAAGVKLLGALVIGLVKAIPDVLKTLNDMINKFIGRLWDIDLNEVGKDILRGFIKGFTSLNIPTPHFHIAGSLDLNPAGGIHFPHVDFDGWYREGGLFAPNSPRLIGVGDASVPEAALPLKPSVLGMIGQKIADTMPQQQAGPSMPEGPIKATLNIGGYQAEGVIDFFSQRLGERYATAGRG